MSTAEEQELMAQISNLAGRINRHKAQQTGQPGHPNRESSTTRDRRHHTYSVSQDATHSTRGASRVAPYPHGNYRGVRGGRAPAYRNKTLVLNGQSRPATNSDDSTPTPTTPNGSWVTKTDRHLQLINSNVYEKESQNRANAIEQTQRNKVLRKDHAEKARLLNYLGKTSTIGVAPASNTIATPPSYEVTVDGIRFQVTREGSKLVRAPGDPNPPTATPRVTTIGGVKFFRTKNGNLIRHGVAKAQRLAYGVKKVDEPCKTFSWTASEGCAVGAGKYASQGRQQRQRGSRGGISDLSSDDDDDDASNDIDSDEVEEFIGKDDEAQDLDFAAQKDYIGFA
ncbi:zinc finger domain-containing protein [Apiospora saccharicola]|uniref:Zinc finger domain-containing protein n=1 Tax=Apiospora saccharicola TaxID=335842 RepID=A0ABR1WN32_9PEZI